MPIYLKQVCNSTDDEKMIMSSCPQRVRLTCDLTRYDNRCKKDSLGWTMPDIRAQWGTMVRYDSGAVLDTLWRSLEILEKETKEVEMEDKKKTCLQEFQDSVISLLDRDMSSDMIRREVTKVKESWLIVKREQKREERKRKR